MGCGTAMGKEGARGSSARWRKMSSGQSLEAKTTTHTL